MCVSLYARVCSGNPVVDDKSEDEREIVGFKLSLGNAKLATCMQEHAGTSEADLGWRKQRKILGRYRPSEVCGVGASTGVMYSLAQALC